MKSYFAIVIITCMVCSYGVVLADTTWVNPVTITSPTTWASSGNPYIIRGGIRIQAGGSLSIQAGTRLYFTLEGVEQPGILVESGATLIAIGARTDSILFSTIDTTINCGNIHIEGLAKFEYCIFKNMTSQSVFNTVWGGALYFYSPDSGSYVSYSRFYGNAAIQNGGAICVSSFNHNSYIEILNSAFEKNHADMSSGAISLFGNNNYYIDGNIKSNIFTMNYSAANGAVGIDGGPLKNVVDIINNIFIDNRAQYEGGVMVNHCNLICSGNLFWRNSVTANNGGIGITNSNISFTNNTLIDNHADMMVGGVLFGVGCMGFADNSIIRGNSAPGGNAQLASVVPLSYCNIEGSYPGTGNIDIDPQFVNATAGNFHLTCSSPCVDAGDPASELDPDYTRADMGAYYYHHLNGAGDANYDCRVMGADVTYLVRYFKGLGSAPYPLWRGDASGDTIVAGADVTYVVRYLKGLGNPPVRNPNCSHPDWSIPDSCNPCGY
jgi:hypothetical protein